MEVRKKCEFTASELAQLKEEAFVMEYSVTQGNTTEDMLYIVHPITSMTKKE
jgi:hypothetical protein